jgi:hypothetical protein
MWTGPLRGCSVQPLESVTQGVVPADSGGDLRCQLSIASQSRESPAGNVVAAAGMCRISVSPRPMAGAARPANSHHIPHLAGSCRSKASLNCQSSTAVDRSPRRDQGGCGVRAGVRHLRLRDPTARRGVDPLATHNAGLSAATAKRSRAQPSHSRSCDRHCTVVCEGPRKPTTQQDCRHPCLAV